jgi:hypothetical protein
VALATATSNFNIGLLHTAEMKQGNSTSDMKQLDSGARI